MSKILISKDNFFHNLCVIETKIGSKEKIAIVLKDNAYGHGIKEIAQLSKEYGIQNAIVKDRFEANIIKNSFKNILVLNDNHYDIFSHTFHIVVNKFDDIAKVPNNAIVHLKIDTGMHRNGIDPKELEASILGLLRQKANIYAIFTHYRSADELSSEFFWQRDLFMGIKAKVKRICEKLNIDLPLFHSCNTAGLFRGNYSIDGFDELYARVGIGAYGYINNGSMFFEDTLKPVLSLVGSLVSKREIKKGERIGYGGGYEAKKDEIISTYDVGYGDGFLRLNESQSYTTPKGYNVIGRVSMDTISLNCDDDEVLIFDDVSKLSKLHNTINYEILTSLKSTIKREIV